MQKLVMNRLTHLHVQKQIDWYFCTIAPQYTPVSKAYLIKFTAHRYQFTLVRHRSCVVAGVFQYTYT